jgi:hypothetical protein
MAAASPSIRARLTSMPAVEKGDGGPTAAHRQLVAALCELPLTVVALCNGEHRAAGKIALVSTVIALLPSKCAISNRKRVLKQKQT